MRKYYLYRFMDINGNIIYIGKTNEMMNRFFYANFAHFTEGSHLSDECYNEISSIEYLEFNNESEQSLYEIVLINHLRPKYNKQFVDDGKILLTSPDFQWEIWEPFSEEIRTYIEMRRDKAHSMQDFFARYFENPLNTESVSFLTTGIVDLDKRIMLRNSNLLLLSGCTGVGKTSLALTICCNLLKNDKNILIISLKDNVEEICLKMLSSESLVPFWKLSSNQLTEDEWIKITTFINHTNNSKNLSIHTDCKLNGILLKIKANQFDCVIIDDFHMIHNESSQFNTDKAFDTLKKLKQVSMQKKLPIVILHSLSIRKVSTHMETRPLLTDFESDSLISLSDTVLFLHRDEMYNPDSLKRNILEVIIAKNKYGNGIFDLIFLPQYMKVVNIAQEPQNVDD